MRIYFKLVLLVIPLIISSIPITNTIEEFTPAIEQTPPLANLQNIPLRPNSLEYNIKIVLLGFDNNMVDANALISKMPSWYAPIERYPFMYSGLSIPTFDVNYTINYDINFIYNSSVTQYRDFIFANSRLDIAPMWIQKSGIESMRYVHSDDVEGYLADRYHHGSDSTLVVINTHSIDTVGHFRYFYNMSGADIDSGEMSVTYDSNYNIAGGGKNTGLNWVDYSAGPSNYRTVTENNYPPIWNYNLNNPAHRNILVSNMAYDLSRAVELRILPSYLYTPQYAYESVTFEFLYVNLDQATNFDYMSQFNPGIFQTELKKLNPNIQWNYYLSEWDWTSNSAFSTIVNNAWDHPNRFIDFTQIRNYLKANYQNMFNTSTSNNLVIPVFNFALPDLYMSSFGGIADSINGEFVFVINIGTYAFIKSGYTITSLPSAMVSTPVNLNTNWYTYANITAGWGGDYVFETNITINSGSMNFYLLDQYNFDQLQLGNSINPIYSSSGLGIGLHSFNLTDFHIKNQYYWIFYATSDTTSFTYRIDRYLDRTFGYTSLALHESGHAVGLSHTHDGFSWNFQSTGMTEYVDWLWDQSYAIMSYIGLPFTLSKVEIDNAQRAIIPKLLDDFILQVNQLNQTIAIHDYIPSEYYLIYENSIDKINQAINNFVIHSYNRSLELIYQGFSLLDEFEFQIDQSLRNINLQISGLDGFPNTETVQVQIWIDGVLIIDELINENTLYVLNNVYWTTYDVIIIYNSVTEYEYHGYTWEISDIMLNLIFPSDDNSSSSSQPSSLLNNSSSSNSGTNILNTDNSSEVPSPFIFYPSIFYIFITLFVFQVFRRKQRN